MPSPATDSRNFELHIRFAKARIAAKELEAVGLTNTECGKLANKLEQALTRYERVRKARK